MTISDQQAQLIQSLAQQALQKATTALNVANAGDAQDKSAASASAASASATRAGNFATEASKSAAAAGDSAAKALGSVNTLVALTEQVKKASLVAVAQQQADAAQAAAATAEASAVAAAADREAVHSDKLAADADAAATAADRVQTGLDRSAAATSESNAAASASTAATLENKAEAAGHVYATTAGGINTGLTGSHGLVGGSGGTNGTGFALVIPAPDSGGVQAVGTFNVSGGAVTAINITTPGSNYAAALTLGNSAFAASAGITGASVVLDQGGGVQFGKYFWVKGTGVLNLYLNNSGTAVDQSVSTLSSVSPALSGAPTAPTPAQGDNSAKIATTAYADTPSATASLGPTSLVNGNSNGAAGWAYIIRTAVALTGTVLNFSLYANAAGSGSLLVLSLNGDGTINLVSETPFSCSVGLNTITTANPAVVAGQYLGLYFSSSILRLDTTINTGFWETNGKPSTNTAKTNVNTWTVEFNAVIAGATKFNIESLKNRATTLETTIGHIESIGPAPVLGAGIDAGNYRYFGQAVAYDGYIEEFEIYASSAGTVTILVVSLNGDGTINLVSSRNVSVQAGYNAIEIGDVAVLAGQYLGLYSSGILRYTSAGAVSTWSTTVLPSTNTAKSVTSAFNFEMRFTIASAMQKDVKSALIKNVGINSGLSLLDAADASGVTDATSLFSSARTAHPSPYVRPGTFALTSIPNYGEGFWGPGAPLVGGVQLPLPKRPINGSLWHRTRAALMSQIYSGSPLIVIGDSITHYQAATSSATQYLNMLCKWLNIGIAADEPIMTALRPFSTYSPSFYGLTTSGTVSTGTNGPINESLILAPGAALSFTGAYEQVDVFYTQGASAGTLAFQYNGAAAYKSVDCSGATDLDHYSGPSATGQTASGTFSITNTHGTNSVEITGLVRLGVKASGSPPRLYVGRFAHGGYSFLSFDSTHVTSILKQAAFAGGTTPKVIIQLGTNDEAGGAASYSALKSRVATLVSALTTAGVRTRDILAIPTWRWGSYAVGGSFEQGDAALHDGYDDAGVRIVPADGFDFISLGLSLSDGHPNDAGNAALFNIIASFLAGV